MTAEGNGEQCPCEPCRERAKKRPLLLWQWLCKHSDLTQPPLPALRWALLLILGLSCWAAGIPLDFKNWLAPIIIAGALILPDVAGFGIAGVRLDLREAKDQLADLRQEVNNQARASSVSLLAIGLDPDKLTATVQTLVQGAAKLASDEATGEATPWQAPSDVDSSPEEDVRS